MKPFLSALALTFALTTPMISAPESTSPETSLVFPTTNARHWTLPNGLVLIVQEDHSSPVASVQVWCGAGSITEDKQLGAGLSHILEHMLFKGTIRRGPNDIAREVQDMGGYINAYTSFERTVYWIDTPAKGVASAIDILADAMMNSTLPEEEYVKEQEVIRREFAMGEDNPDRMSSLTLFGAAYREHPYKYPVIGHIDVYNKLTRDDVMAYYKARYVPNNLFFVVTGDVDAEKVHAQVSELFAKHPRQALAPVNIPQEPPQLGRREEHKEFPTELTRLEVAWHIPEVTHPDVPALDLLSLILGSGRSSQLYRSLRDDQNLVHGINAWCYTPGHPGLFGVEATLDPAKREKVQEEILSAIEKLKATGVTDQELAKAKRKTLSSQLSGLTTTRGRASDLGTNWMLTRNLNFTKDYLEGIQKVTKEDILRVLNTYFEDRNLTIISLNPVGSLATVNEEKKAIEAKPIQKFTLSNGLRLLVREDPRLPLVSAIATFKAGLLAETPENNGVTRLVSKTILKGTKSRSAEVISEEIESLGGAIGSDAGMNSFSVSIGVMKPDLAQGLDILADVIQHPTFPEAAIAREKEAQFAAIKAEDEQMTSVARNLMRRTLYPEHPMGLNANGTVPSVTGLTQDQLKAFHKEFITGKNGVIAVFGDVKAEEVKNLVEKLFTNLPAGEEALTKPKMPTPLAESILVEEAKDKAQAILMIAYPGVDLFSRDRRALELIDVASSDLGSRFFVRIRENLGLAYFVGSSQAPGLVPGPFVFYLGTDPAKVEQVKKEFVDEIGKLAKEGLTEGELKRAKEKLLGQQEIRNQSNAAFAHATALDELYGIGFNDYQRLREEVEAITLDDVKAVAQKYFLQKPAVTAIVRPEPRKEEPKKGANNL